MDNDIKKMFNIINDHGNEKQKTMILSHNCDYGYYFLESCNIDTYQQGFGKRGMLVN